MAVVSHVEKLRLKVKYNKGTDPDGSPHTSSQTIGVAKNLNDEILMGLGRKISDLLKSPAIELVKMTEGDLLQE